MLYLESVANSPYCVNILGLGWVKFYLFSYSFYMDSDSTSIPYGVIIPDFLKEVLLGIDLAGVFHQKAKKLKLFGSKGNLLLPGPDSGVYPVYFKASNFHDIVFFFCAPTHVCEPLESGKVGLDPGHQLPRGKGLCYIIIRTQTQTANLIYVVLSGRNYKYRGLLGLSDGPTDFKSIHPRKHYIYDKEVKWLCQSHFNTFISGGTDGNLISIKLKIIFLEFGYCLVVFYYQYSCHPLLPLFVPGCTP